jgi:hypothetical protein
MQAFPAGYRLAVVSEPLQKIPAKDVVLLVRFEEVLQRCATLGSAPISETTPPICAGVASKTGSPSGMEDAQIRFRGRDAENWSP